jgi:hypothetical protein
MKPIRAFERLCEVVHTRAQYAVRHVFTMSQIGVIAARRRIRLDPIIYRDARHVPSDRRFYLRSFFDPDLLKK